MKKFFISALIITFSYLTQAQCPTGRYLNNLFQTDTLKDIIYGWNTKASGSGTDTLKLDLYLPEADALEKRPLIIFAHGGSFYGGTKSDGDVTYYADQFAKKGYVCASISYRLESIIALSSLEKMVKEVLRASQDGRAAVRYFRKDAATSNLYKIDPNQIYFAGSSAGGILAIHVAYLQDADPLPATWVSWGNAIGGLEGNSGNPGYSSQVQGIVSFAGAIADTAYLQNRDIPWIGFHAHRDGTVPDSIGYPFGLPLLPTLMGSQMMHVKSLQNGTFHEYYPYNGSYHPPYADGLPSTWDSIESKTAYFLYQLLACNTEGYSGISEPDAFGQVAIYPNPNQGSFVVRCVNSSSGKWSVYSIDGTKCMSGNYESADFSIEFKSMPGIYVLETIDANSGKRSLQKVQIQ